jgi:hypothetical protein
MKTETKHYVTFSSPGIMFSENTTREIGEWDTRAAMKMAGEIRGRHGARPFGFQFETRRIVSDIEDGSGGFMPETSKEERRSGTYFICGRVLTQEDVDSEYGAESTLAWNMRCNEWLRVVETTNGYKHVAIFGDGDCLVDADGTVLP